MTDKPRLVRPTDAELAEIERQAADVDVRLTTPHVMPGGYVDAQALRVWRENKPGTDQAPG